MFAFYDYLFFGSRAIMFAVLLYDALIIFVVLNQFPFILDFFCMTFPLKNCVSEVVFVSYPL